MKNIFFAMAIIAGLCLSVTGCSTAGHRQRAEQSAAAIIKQKQQEGLGRTEPFTVESPAEQLRRRLLLDQQLPYAGPASLGSRYLPLIPHWPEPEMVGAPLPVAEPTPPVSSRPALLVTLVEALQIAARNSREYQTRKEEIFRQALDLELERDRFRHTFTGQLTSTYTRDRRATDTVTGETEGIEGSAAAAISRTLLGGMQLTARLGLDLVRLLEPSRLFSSSLFGDASITIPLGRGAGRHIVGEPLTQAEREVLYAVWDFERFKKEFAVDITANYLAVLQAADQVRNQEENYRGLIASSRRARRLAEAGKTPQIQVDQAVQNELRARDRWIAAQKNQARALDQFKNLLGLPTDAELQLDRAELKALEAYINQRLPQTFAPAPTGAAAPADTPIVPAPPALEERGPLELLPDEAIRTALANRLDLRTSEGRVYDAQRRVVVAADNLGPELSLFGTATAGEHRRLGTAASADSNRLDFGSGYYQALLTLDLPLERTAEANAYRASYLDLEQAGRDVQELEDRIKLQIRDALRDLEQARSSLQIQHQAVKLAERRVRGAELHLEAGRAEIRDLLEAQEALLTAQNALTAAMIDYRLAELGMQRDLGTLQVGEN